MNLKSGKYFIFLIFLSFSLVVRADFVSDPFRDDSKGFPAFFLTQLENWISKQPQLKIEKSALEKSYIDSFNKTATKFGLKKKTGFLRAVDYKIKTKNQNTFETESVRFIDLENRSALKSLAFDLLKKVAPKLNLDFLNNKEMGLGFGRKNADIEIVFWEENLLNSRILATYPNLLNQISEHESGEIIAVIKNSKIISAEVLQLGKAPPASVTCPAAALFNQTDRVLYDDGKTSWIWHLDHFQDLAISNPGRKIYEAIWSGMNLNPGAIDWRSKDDYSLMYP